MGGGGVYGGATEGELRFRLATDFSIEGEMESVGAELIGSTKPSGWPGHVNFVVEAGDDGGWRESACRCEIGNAVLPSSGQHVA
jgi:hypothetical protein